MSTEKRSTDFFTSEEGLAIEQLLQLMVADNAYNTEPSYSANSVLYPNNLMPFVDKHMAYLRLHPMIDARHYVSNLRLMTRLK